MRSSSKSALCLASAAAVLGGCASVPVARESLSERVCVRTREINSLGALDDDRHVFVNVSADRYYLLSVDQACIGLRFATGMAIADGETRVCDDGFSFIEFVNPNLGPMRCRVELVDPVASKAAARELIGARESDEPEKQ